MGGQLNEWQLPRSCSYMGGEETSSFVLGGDEAGRSAAQFQAVHLSLVTILASFFFLGQDSSAVNGGSDLSVLNDRSPCVGKSLSQRAAAFTC